ncbi:MAG: exo-alpha-sialidase [Planctomycetes bacterium]|nr:exo-alpha-sialidase [Planctomycetota bacterium]
MITLRTRPLPATIALVAFLLLNLPALAAPAEPARAYVQTPTGERPQPIVAVQNVCAWPNLTLLRDGTIIATIFNQPNHGQTAGDVDCWATQDGGKTWHKRGTPAPHEPDCNRMNVAAGLATGGDLLVVSSGWSNRYPPEKQGSPFRAGILAPWVCRSADGGRTWSIDQEAFPAQGPNGGVCIPFGDIVIGYDGALRVAIYSVILERRTDRVYVYRSADDGKTWGDPAALDEDALRNETALVHLGEGEWLAAVRENGMHLHRSDDDARTWTYRMRLTPPAQHPGHLLRLSDGRILLSSGNRTGNEKGVDARFSPDEGQSWTDPLRIVDFQGDGGYPASVQLPDGQILTAYYARKTAAHDGYHMGVVTWDPGK